MENNKKLYKVHITETFGRSVVISAEDEYEAVEIAENLCNNGVIDITSSDDFGDRNVEVVGTPDSDERKRLVTYG